MKTTLIIFALSFVAIGISCSDKTSHPAHDARIIKQAYDEWVEITNTKDIDRWSSYLAPTAEFLPPDNPPLLTVEEIREYYINLFQDPHFRLDCEVVFVHVSESGDMAWSRGICEGTFSDEDGMISKGSSKWTKVWIRQDDGTWKCRLNTWNYN